VKSLCSLALEVAQVAGVVYAEVAQCMCLNGSASDPAQQALCTVREHGTDCLVRKRLVCSSASQPVLAIEMQHLSANLSLRNTKCLVSAVSLTTDTITRVSRQVPFLSDQGCTLPSRHAERILE
jgi:hypothetical protein